MQHRRALRASAAALGLVIALVAPAFVAPAQALGTGPVAGPIHPSGAGGGPGSEPAPPAAAWPAPAAARVAALPRAGGPVAAGAPGVLGAVGLLAIGGGL